MYANLNDNELKEIRNQTPKYLNDMTDEQKKISMEVYTEQKKRFDAEKEYSYQKYNEEVEAAGYKVGDKVSYFCRLLLGIGGIVITGKVAKRKKYFVALDHPMNGKKSAHLTKAWKHI